MSSGHDPYQPLAQGLRYGDAINGFLLSNPRKKIIEYLKGQRVLDVCCGTGSLAAMLAKSGCQVVGVDSSPTMLSYAQSKRVAAEFRLLDAARLLFDHEFDAAVISLALHEMRPDIREQVWGSMNRAVRPDGRLIALDYAVPLTTSIFGRIAGSLVEQDEKSFVNIHPDHYTNFAQFMGNGGLRAWIREQKASVETEYDFWSGTVAVVICRRSEDRVSAETDKYHERNLRDTD